MVHIEGDDEHPINEGALCSKGMALTQLANSDRRITRPLYRRPGGTEWEEKPWDWALSRIASLIVPSKLHPLWYSRMVPLFFFVSALAGGLCVLIIEGTVSQRVFHHHVDIHVFRGLARAAVVVLILYGAMKIGDLMFRGGLSRMAMDREGIFFGMEIMIGIVLPLLLYALPGIRETRQGLFAFACLGVTGLILNRINVSLIGMAGSSSTSYFPSWMEFAITATLILTGVALFRWAARSLPVFEKQA